jgi:NAD(P)-dependent dehydrogenase (short-subunit alcohol dehydrogenase family)
MTDLTGKSVIITGAANGIGLETALQYYAKGANIVIADLASSQTTAEEAINRLEDPSRALFVPVDITRWDELGRLFAETNQRFGRVDIVIANAGIMESSRFFDFHVDEKGELKDDGFSRVIDVNLKGTMNSTLTCFTKP